MSYPADYWSDRVGIYSDQEWSKYLSPFGEEVLSHLPKTSRVLELGMGAGQDSIGFAKAGHTVIGTDGVSTEFESIQERAGDSSTNLSLQQVNLTAALPFEDSSFDLVYAQLVLHYFDDDEMKSIMDEILRVIRPGGLLAVLTNTIEDPEIDELEPYKSISDMRVDRGVVKRYFSVESLAPFVDKYDSMVFDNKGRTPKDDAVGVGSLIRFIGQKPQ